MLLKRRLHLALRRWHLLPALYCHPDWLRSTACVHCEPAIRGRQDCLGEPARQSARSLRAGSLWLMQQHALQGAVDRSLLHAGARAVLLEGARFDTLLSALGCVVLRDSLRLQLQPAFHRALAQILAPIVPAALLGPALPALPDLALLQRVPNVPLAPSADSAPRAEPLPCAESPPFPGDARDAPLEVLRTLRSALQRAGAGYVLHMPWCRATHARLRLRLAPGCLSDLDRSPRNAPRDQSALGAGADTLFAYCLAQGLASGPGPAWL